MKKKLLTAIFVSSLCGSMQAQDTPHGYPYSPVPFTSVKVTDSFWGQRLKASREVTIPLAFSKCEESGRYENFVKAAHPSENYKVEGLPFDDTDVYKTIEGASYLLQTYPDKKLKSYIDSVLAIVAAAQEPDGYLYTSRTMNPKHPHAWSGSRRWEKVEDLSHEFYNLGHMVEGAIAHYQATGKRNFLDIAIRYADCVCREIGPGEGQQVLVPGHQIAEMALAKLYIVTGDQKYLDFSKNFIDYFVQEDGSIQTYDPKEYNLDNVNQGKNLFILYDIFGDEKYRKAIDTIRSQLLTQPRTKEGNFWHKDIYPWQVWLDGTYMAQPFYMEYETRFNKMQGCIDSYKQFMNIKKHMRDEKTGLYYHGYDESRQMYWADPETGCSPNFWLRAMGWFLVAMVDVLERMDEQLYNEYRGIMAMLKQTVEDMHKFQDEQTGMFWQVIDHPEAEGNYLETSGTALFAYAVLKGVRLGYLPKRMAAWAEKAFYGTCDRYLSKNPDGSLQLDGICLVAGLGGKDHRDGSLAYYFSEPVVCNDAKGVGPLVLAYTEMIARK